MRSTQHRTVYFNRENTANHTIGILSMTTVGINQPSIERVRVGWLDIFRSAIVMPVGFWLGLARAASNHVSLLRLPFSL